MNLREIASVIRTKNAGPYWFTADIMFDNTQLYEAVKKSQAITRERVAQLYNVDPENISEVIYHDEGRIIKVNIKRPHVSGDPGDADVLGMQQHAPLLDIDINFHKLFR